MEVVGALQGWLWPDQGAVISGHSGSGLELDSGVLEIFSNHSGSQQ